MEQRNRLKKRPPQDTPRKGTVPDSSVASGVNLNDGLPVGAWQPINRMAESRTMAYARALTTQNLSETSSVGNTGSTSEWTPAQTSRPNKTVLPPERRAMTSQLNASLAVTAYADHPEGELYDGQHSVRPPRPYFYYQTLVRQCIDRPVHAIQRTVTAVEHLWAMRATRAEALLDAHTRHREELSTLSASMEERRVVGSFIIHVTGTLLNDLYEQRELAALNDRFSQELARHRLMMVRLTCSCSTKLHLSS
ncbi:hypothetical protein NUW54_g10944 [Trametes sanguinea]|uniref:Uncharacterized protein n=1 Tax=Trametes sanguinea TaxID=158606 RepID=A0ACC1NRB4_9APHY|nr:hypothetical protein NUW54_g10944 [Trametes sanguinea]